MEVAVTDYSQEAHCRRRIPPSEGMESNLRCRVVLFCVCFVGFCIIDSFHDEELGISALMARRVLLVAAKTEAQTALSSHLLPAEFARCLLWPRWNWRYRVCSWSRWREGLTPRGEAFLFL